MLVKMSALDIAEIVFVAVVVLLGLGLILKVLKDEKDRHKF